MSLAKVAHGNLPELLPQVIRRAQRTVLVTSTRGRERRSTQMTLQLLTRLGCVGELFTAKDALVSNKQEGLQFMKRSKSTMVVGIGGNTVLDVSKAIADGCQQASGEPVSVILVPTIPCHGKETTSLTELIDPQEGVLLAAKPVFHSFDTLIDQNLAVFDRMPSNVEYAAFVCTLSHVLNTNDSPDMDLLRSSLVEWNAYPNSREAKFRLSAHGVPLASLEDTANSFPSVGLARMLTPELALPRILILASLFLPSLMFRYDASNEFRKVVHEVTARHSREDVLRFGQQLVKEAGVDHGLLGLLKSRGDANQVWEALQIMMEEQWAGEGDPKSFLKYVHEHVV